MRQRPFVRAAIGLTRAMLRLFPAAFRSEMGEGLVRDVGRRAEEVGDRLRPIRRVLWLLRLTASLAVNAVGARSDARRTRSEVAGKMRGIGGGVSWLDFKLGFRMLVRFPGLTLVAGLAIAFAIGLGTGTYQFFTDWYTPTMPFEGGDRVVELWKLDREAGRRDPRLLHDYVTWQEELSTVVEVGAYSSFRRNLITERGGSTPLVGATMSTAAFEMARTPPILGRPLVSSDEAPGSPQVVLLSYEVWDRRFGLDPSVIGRTVRLGAEPATVVGVMPEGFGWPRAYQLWTALQLDPLAYRPGEGPALQVVGKLAQGASLESAQAELAAIATPWEADGPGATVRPEPRLEKYGSLDLGVGELVVLAFKSMSSLAFLGLLVLVCGNVALLLFARTTARQSEIVVRGALGASRARIVTQLLAEALVLGFAGGAAGLAVASIGYEWTLGLLRDLGPGLVGYWMDGRLDPGTVIYALLFTLVGAVIAGVAPALKATSRGVHARLQRVGTSGPDLEFGRLWSAIIVGQIAVTVAFVPIVGIVGHAAWELGNRPFGMPAEEYLIAELGYRQSTGTISDLEPGIRRVGYTPAFASAHEEVKRRLELESGVAAVTMAEQVPGAPSHRGWVLMDGASAPMNSPRGHYVSTTSVDVDFFRALNVPMTAGRSFTVADGEPGQRVVIVDEVFVREILEDRGAIGRRFELDDRWGPIALNSGSFEIVGVVRQVLRGDGAFDETRPAVYFPLASTSTYPVRVAVRVGTNPTAFSARLRQIVTEVDPGLILTDVRSMENADWATRRSFETWFWVLLTMGLMGVTLALAGLYSIVSFTVSRRTREIGVRVALGANPPRVVLPIMRRALRQITIGALVGTVLFWGIVTASELRFRPEPGQLLGFVAYVVVMALVCGTACIVPVRRALSIEPTEALAAN